MASSGQRMSMEKPSSTTTLTHAGSQNSLTEAGSAQSHLHDVRAPELVYNIDEETRMGPETTNDGVNPPSSESVVKEREGKILDSKSAPKEESSTANPSNTPFSALSFIASQYAESDNSSPRSSNSPSGMLEDNGSNLVPKPPESAGHSSDGFETSSLLPDAEADPKQPTSGVEVEEGKVCVGDIGSGGDASAQCVAQGQPGVASDAPPKMETEVSKDVDVSKDMAQAELAPDEPGVQETGLDKDADVKEHVRDVEMDKEMKKDSDVSTESKDKEMKKDSDVSTESKEENMTVKVEAEADRVTEPVSTVDVKDVTDDISEGVSEDVAEVVSKLVDDETDKQQIQDLAAASAGLDNKNVTPSHSEPMETAEPMETDDSKEQQGDVEEKMVTEDTDQDREKDTLDMVQTVTDTPEESKREPDADMLMTSDTKLAPNAESDMPSDMPSDTPSDSKQQANTDLLHSEDAKVESGVAQNMETAAGEDSRQASDADVVMNEDSIPAPSVGSVVTEGCKLLSHVDSVVSEESKLASNMDSVMSDDSKLVPNVDSVMSEDSKLLSNLDCMLSGGLDESEDFYEVKGPSAVVPFGENANSSMPIMGTKSLLEVENSNFSFVDESSQSNSMAEKPSRPKRARRSSISDIQDSKNEIEDGLQPFPAERVFEYQWPQDGGEWYLLQEQISEYLGVLSFKRKYPDLTRRTCDKLEKEFLREKGVVTETQSDLGLTAIRSEEVYDLMMKDYPDKYHEYATLLHEREKQKISDKHKEYEVAQPKLEKSKMADYMKKAAKSAAEYNRHLLREKREERLAFFDLQTFMIQYPEGRYKKLSPECTKPSAYPVALIPGQFQDHYCSYTSDELRYFPLNTALYDPPKKMSNTLAKPAGSGESSDDSSEDKSGSSSDSSGSGSGSSDSETPAAAAAAASAKGNSADTSQPAAVPATPAEPAVTPGKKTGKKVSKTPAKTPAKSPGKVLKGKRKLETNVEEKEPSGTASTPLVPASPAVQPASPAPNKEKVEEDEDKDKCRICKNAVLFLKYKRVETKMIKCSECGKIAHPTCLDLTDKMVQVVTTYPWQCMECKTCVECMDPYDEDKMLFCDRCDRGYHTFCVGLRCLPTGRWECRSCKGVAETAKSRRGRPIKPT